MGVWKCLNANWDWRLADREVFLNQWVKCLISNFFVSVDQITPFSLRIFVADGDPIRPRLESHYA